MKYSQMESACSKPTKMAGNASLTRPANYELYHRHCEERQRRSNPCFRMPRYGLLRFARNDDVETLGATKRLVGQINKTCPALTRKRFPLSRRANQHQQLPRPSPQGQPP